LDGITNPQTVFTFQGNANDATTIQTKLNTLFNVLGFVGSPVTVTRTASGTGSATFSLAFAGSMANRNVLQLTPSVTAGTGSAVNTTLVQGGAPNLTTINQNTQLQV